MTNNNLADISAFESLQANQHVQTGMSQMAVFNDVNAVRSAVQKYADLKKEDSSLYYEIGRAKNALRDILTSTDNLGFKSDAERTQAVKEKEKEIQKLESRNKQLEALVKQQFETVKQEIKGVGDSWLQSNDSNISTKEWQPLISAFSEPLRGSTTFTNDIKAFRGEADKALNKFSKKNK
jgi:uncharacterized protein (DUF3084 family)